VRLQPEQTIYWKVINKVPGLKFQVQQMRMDLLYASKFSAEGTEMPEAYERLLLEVIAADHSHFVSAEELDASWRIFTPLLQQLAARNIKPLPYAYGSRGPAAADALAHKYGMSKFGGGITTYVQGQPANVLAQGHDDDALGDSCTSNTLATSALASATPSSVSDAMRAGRSASVPSLIGHVSRGQASTSTTEDPAPTAAPTSQSALSIAATADATAHSTVTADATTAIAATEGVAAIEGVVMHGGESDAAAATDAVSDVVFGAADPHGDAHALEGNAAAPPTASVGQRRRNWSTSPYSTPEPPSSPLMLLQRDFASSSEQAQWHAEIDHLSPASLSVGLQGVTGLPGTPANHVAVDLEPVRPAVSKHSLHQVPQNASGR